VCKLNPPQGPATGRTSEVWIWGSDFGPDRVRVLFGDREAPVLEIEKSRRNLLVVQPPPRPDLSAKTIVDVLVQNVDETRCKEADLRLHYTYLVA